MARLDQRAISEMFGDAVARSGAVGAQLSVVLGRDRLDLALGSADATRGVPMTPDTLMQIGSITKVFNAAVVMSLVDEGRLVLDEPIGRYLPGTPVATPDARDEVTLRQLLSMSSGLDNGPYCYFGRGDDALGRYVAQLASLPRHFAPGRYFGYSNAGACIAGWIASTVTGSTWERLLWERVLAPMGLRDAAIADEDVGDRIVSVGHLTSEGGAPRTVEPRFSDLRARAPSGPSFALRTSDLASFGLLLMRGGISDRGAQTLSGDAVAEMLSPQIVTPIRKYGSDWCLGPCSGSWGGHRVWGHGGTSPTATSYLYWLPDRQGAVALVANTHAAMGELSQIVLEDMCRSVFGYGKPHVDVPDSSAGAFDSRRYVGRYQELGMAMDVTAADDGTLRAHLVPRAIVCEMGVPRAEQRATLRHLGGDRLLFEPLGGPDRHRGIVDTAFFGDDGAGRATNALNLVFPMSRVASDFHANVES